jgi:hypothetical protein
VSWYRWLVCTLCLAAVDAVAVPGVRVLRLPPAQEAA